MIFNRQNCDIGATGRIEINFPVLIQSTTSTKSIKIIIGIEISANICSASIACCDLLSNDSIFDVHSIRMTFTAVDLVRLQIVVSNVTDFLR